MGRKDRCGEKVKFKRYLELRDIALTRLVHPESEYHKVEPDLQTYAFLGDGAYALFVRTKLVATGLTSTQILHDIAARVVSAKMQSAGLRAIWDNLSAQEQEICRRARNISVTAPHSATMAEYKQSTAWEALIGYHVYQGADDRATEIMECSFAVAIKELSNGQK